MRVLGGSIHVYPFQSENPIGPKRSEEAYNKDVIEAMKITGCINGVKGVCCLSY